MYNSQLNLKQIPKVVGDGPRKTCNECYRQLQHTRIPIFLTGPSGSGKSIVAMNLAKRYSIKNSVPAFYVQLSPDQTKTNLILGLRLVNGSLEVVNGVVADCMESGGIIVIDETAHGTPELMLMLNSLLDRTAITSIGDKTIIAKDSFRVIFCANDSTYAGNNKLPQSFAQRQVVYFCGYPTWEDEVKIALELIKSECDVKLTVPDVVVKYITSVISEIRKDNFPLSVRNIASAAILLGLRKKITDDEFINNERERFESGPNTEATRRKIACRILNQEVQTAKDLVGGNVGEFINFICTVGIDNFVEDILRSTMYYLDIDTGISDIDIIRQGIRATII